MALSDDLKTKVAEIFRATWSKRAGRIVPTPEALQHGNDAVEFERATFLYADLSGSTAMVNAKAPDFTAEVYKTFLHCAATIIKAEGGAITSYDGDRVMGVWVGERQSTPAAICGLKINFAVTYIINPALAAQYPTANYVVKQVVGIDTSPIRAARVGVRGDNDIVWVGRAANYAAKLTELDLAERTWITNDVFERLQNEAKFGGPNANELMWKPYRWTKMEDYPIHGSTWWKRV